MCVCHIMNVTSYHRFTNYHHIHHLLTCCISPEIPKERLICLSLNSCQELLKLHRLHRGNCLGGLRSQIPSLKLTWHLKIGRPPKRKLVFQPAIFRCELLVSERVAIHFWLERIMRMFCIHVPICSWWFFVEQSGRCVQGLFFYHINPGWMVSRHDFPFFCMFPCVFWRF